MPVKTWWHVDEKKIRMCWTLLSLCGGDASHILYHSRYWLQLFTLYVHCIQQLFLMASLFSILQKTQPLGWEKAWCNGACARIAYMLFNHKCGSFHRVFELNDGLRDKTAILCDPCCMRGWKDWEKETLWEKRLAHSLPAKIPVTVPGMFIQGWGKCPVLNSGRTLSVYTAVVCLACYKIAFSFPN